MSDEKTTWYRVKLIFPHKTAYLATTFINGARLLGVIDAPEGADVFPSVMSAISNAEAFMVRFEGGRFVPYYEIVEE